MSNEAAKIIAELRANMPDGNCSIRVSKRDIISEAWTSGLDVARVDTEQGQVDTLVGSVRYAATAETTPDPNISIAVGDKIEIKQGHDAEYQEARVSGRFQSAGAIRLELGAEFE